MALKLYRVISQLSATSPSARHLLLPLQLSSIMALSHLLCHRCCCCSDCCVQYLVPRLIHFSLNQSTTTTHRHKCCP